MSSTDAPRRTQILAVYLARSLPWTVVSLLFLADALSLRLLPRAPWALLILAPALFFPPGAAARGGSSRGFSYSVLIPLSPMLIPLIAGSAEAAGLLDGAPLRPWDLVYLAVALAVALLGRRLGADRDAAAAEDLHRREERERSLSKVRDAEVEIAARIQRALLLDPPGQYTRELALEAITVASNAVDGDFYGFIPFSSTQVDILVGDVMGKGVPAALVGAALKSSFLRSTLRLIVEDPQRLPRPEELVSSVHRSVVSELMSLDSFATLQYARVDAAALRVDFVDCGHTSFLHYDSSLRLCWTLRGTNLPVGFVEDPACYAYSISLSPGDRLLFYSDGVSEAANESGELFGEGRLAAILAGNAWLEPRELVRRILNTAMFFASSQGFRDDVTCVAVAVDPELPPPGRVGRDFTCETASLSGLRGFLAAHLQGLSAARREEVSAAAAEVAAAVIALVPREDGEAPCPQALAALPGCGAGGEGAGIDEIEAVEALEAVEAKLPDLRVYRVEVLSLPRAVALRFLYRGPSLPWPRGALPALCAAHPTVAFSFGSSGPDLHLLSLLIS